MNNIDIPVTSESEPAKQPPKKKFSKRRELASTLSLLILAPLIAFLLTIFIFQSYQVDGPSMEKTLYHNDRLIVLKTGKTWSRITGSDYIPKRYSIIVFNHTGPTGSYEVSKKQLIKRVIGLPGDRVVIKDGIVTIYNAENPNGFQPDREGPESSVITSTDGNVEQTIKDGEVFVLGDNRANSLDSRAFGSVRSQDIVGQLSVRILPFGEIKKF